MRKWLVAPLILALALLAVPRADAFKGTVTIALTGEPLTMDPHIQSEFIGTMVWPWACDNLVQVAAKDVGGFKPWLAEKWERVSATEYKFTIRKNAKFNDGTPVTAAAVKFSIERIISPKTKSRLYPYFKTIARVDAPDPRTAVIHLKSPDNGILNLLQRWGHIINPKVAGMPKAEVSRNPQCSGPYLLRKWDKGQKMVFEANPDWWGNSMYPNRPKHLILRRIKERTTRVKALLAGEVDIITGLPPHFVGQVKKDPKHDVASVPAVRMMYVSYFTKFGGPFANRKVRLAVNRAIDNKLIVKTLHGGFADPYYQVLHPWVYSGYNPKMTSWNDFDLGKARQLMKEAGYANGFKAYLFSPNGRYPADKETCEAVAGMLKKIKINAPCHPVTFPLYRRAFNAFQKGKRKGAAMYLQAYGNGAGYTSVSLRGFGACNGAWSPHCFKKFDAMVDKAVGTGDIKKQQKLFEKAQSWMRSMATHKPLLKIHEIWGISKSVKVTPSHNENLPAWEIEVKKATN